MARFTDHFIQRPVLATVVSLLILIFGLRAIFALPLRQFPRVENTVITISTLYPGASADLIRGFITTPIENAIASADGIDYITSSSNKSQSTISAYILLNYDPQKAFTDIMSKVAEVRKELPNDAEDPVIRKATGSQVALMYISFSSKKMSSEQITDYINRVIRPKIETIDGVAKAQVLGARTFAVRIWLDPQKMAAYQITPGEVVDAMQRNHFQSAAGKTKGEFVAFDVNADTDLNDVDNFKKLVIKNDGSALTRLRDVARIELGSKNYDSTVSFNGDKATFIAVTAAPEANPLTVINDVRKMLPTLKPNYPPTLSSKVVYDATRYIRASIREVIRTIIEATLIVIAVIFLFLGNFRAVAIPVVTIPLSLIGVCSLLLPLGYTINLFTLLAMVLAIGLVVDDAIVVVENIHRHIEEGIRPFDAAIKGAMEIAWPVVAMTITLAAVYSPIAFMGGLTGALFKEFAFTLAGAVIVSGVIALTLSPMMCANLLTAKPSALRLTGFIDRSFLRLKDAYHRRLHAVLDYRPVTVVFIIVVLFSCFYLYTHTQKQLAPVEDQSVLFVAGSGPEYANIDYMNQYADEFNGIFRSVPQTQDYFIVSGSERVNQMFGGTILKPWDERRVTQEMILPGLQDKVGKIAGLNTAVFPLPPLPVGRDGLPIQFVLTTTEDNRLLYQYTQQLLDKANSSGLFLFVDSTLKFNKPELQVKINRSKAAELGISMEAIGRALSASFGEGEIERFSLVGRSYEIIPQVERKFRHTPEAINQIYVKTESGDMIPLSTVVTIKQTVEPNSLRKFQQLNSAAIEGVMTPGRTIADVLDFLKTQADALLPKTITYDYAGESRRFVKEGAALVLTFFFALLVIYLVLAAQFESFRDPFIILISVPMSVCGALIPLNLGAATINIYTQVGLITLIGLISKHGILMVEFANKLQLHENLSIRAAIEKAASIRLRPVLMTTAATVLGVMPLIFARGAGANSRYSIGVVIAAGMVVGTLFTLFVVPTIYTFFAKDHREPLEEAIANEP